MIKEFWQEQREEKKRLKQLKKQNKKTPKTKEQIAYKVFGVIFVLFLVFGSIGYACRGSGNLNISDYDWSDAYGLTEEMKAELEKPVSVNEIVPSGIIDARDFSDCASVFADAGVSIEKDGLLDMDTLLNSTVELSKSVTLSNRQLGGLLQRELLDFLDDDVNLVDCAVFVEGESTKLKSVVLVNLSNILSGSKLPFVYITTESQIVLHDGDKVQSLFPTYRINNIDNQLCQSIVDTINGNKLYDLSRYTNSLLCTAINQFAQLISAKVSIDGGKITFQRNDL